MKKNFLRKMALVMSSVLLISTALTGCGSSEKPAETEKAAVQAEAAASEDAEAAEVDRTNPLH